MALQLPYFINRKQVYLAKRILAVIVIIGVPFYFYRKFNSVKISPQLQAQKETASLVSTVGKLMQLPKNETPTIAIVSDKNKLTDQPFFRDTQNGDTLLTYNNAMIAVLYRSSTHKIINTATISSSLQQNLVADKKQGASTDTALSIAYYNGTEVTGLAALIGKIVKEKYPSWQTSTVTNALKRDYKETLVVDVAGGHSQEAGNLASLLGGKIAQIPPGEVVPRADILIISAK